MTQGWRIGFATQGLSLHRIDDALEILAAMGYRGVFLTFDAHHLDPFAGDYVVQRQRVVACLQRLDLQAVIETGARFLLDPWRKHHPTLLQERGFEPRVQLIEHAIDLAAECGSRVISIWSGALAQGMDARSAFERLVERLKPLLDRAVAQGVRIGFEPEPGMLIETVADYHRLHRALHAHAALGLSLDCGHLLVTGEDPPQLVLAREQEHLVAIAIEDMRVGIHEHLPFGAGDVDLPALTAALKDLPFEGVVAVELGRHAHDGPREAARARRSLEPLGVPFAPWRAPWPLESA